MNNCLFLSHKIFKSNEIDASYFCQLNIALFKKEQLFNKKRKKESKISLFLSLFLFLVDNRFEIGGSIGRMYDRFEDDKSSFLAG